MKFPRYKSIFAIALAIGLFGFLFPSTLQARSYAEGSVLKAETDPKIYYVASDGLAYPFPDAKTYRTWYANFSNVHIIPDREMRRVKKSKTNITVRPGRKLIMFEDSNRVYVSTRGAVLRHIRSAKIAKEIEGTGWQKKIIVLPIENVGSYTFGDAITKASEYKASRERIAARTIDRELSNRKVLKLKKSKTKSKVPKTGLKSIRENLRSSLSPRFKQEVTTYFLVAKHTEKVLELRLEAYDKDARISINGAVIPSGSTVSFKISEDKNEYKIKVIDDPEPKEYTLFVTREQASTNNRLSSLKENLDADLNPRFDPEREHYTLAADFEEEFIKLTARAKDKNAHVNINGKKLGKGSSATIKLKKGKNTIRVYVIAQNGDRRGYVLEVYRAKRSTQQGALLSSLTVSGIDDKLSPFYPKKKLYVLNAKADEDFVTVSAKAKTKSHIITIDGETEKKKKVKLHPGKNTIKIQVKGPTGAKVSYRIIINKPIQ